MEQLKVLIIEAVKELFDVTADVTLTRPDEQFGDFSSNVALQLAKQVGQNPREIAERLAAYLRSDVIEKAEVAGPGFINLTLSDRALVSEVLSFSERNRPLMDFTIVIETNNPNPFKAMHIGHAFNAILADTIANLLDTAGARTHRVSYHGDVGLHVGKSMYALLRYIDGDPSKLDGVPEAERNSFMSRMYAEGSAAYKDDEAAKAEIDELAKQSFTREDPRYAAVYDTVMRWSFQEIDANVARLGSKPVERRFLESEAELRGVRVVRDHTPEVFQESDGALVFKGSEHGAFDNAFVSARGTGLYAARDLGLIQLKTEAYHPDKSYIVTAEEQRAYFKGVIAAAELCMPELAGVTVNIPHGTVRLTTGKMSSRDGEVVEIGWLFDAIAEAITARGGTPDDALIAGALRYEFLRVRVGSDVIFDVNEAVSIQGNSGPYLQYAHARARSILKKTDYDGPFNVDHLPFLTDERLLLRRIGEYAEVLERAGAEQLPHHICTYLFELAQKFNSFYEHNRVIGDPREPQRLFLVAHYAEVLKHGLGVLGIHAPDRM